MWIIFKYNKLRSNNPNNNHKDKVSNKRPTMVGAPNQEAVLKQIIKIM